MIQNDLHNYTQKHYEHRDSSDKEINVLVDITESIDFKPDTEKAWACIFDKIKGEEMNPINMRLWIRIAAVFLLITSAVFVVYYTQNLAKPLISVQTNDTVKIISLPDGSELTLNKYSEISYPEDFTKREVSLRGEAFFDVKKRSGAAFTVRTSDYRVIVTGTQFNIREDDKEITVSVTEGEVNFGSDESNIALRAGMEGILNISAQKLATRADVNYNEFVYASKQFVFNDESLSSVVETLSMHFNTQIVLDNESIGKCTLSGHFDSENLVEILESICIVLDLKLDSKQKQYLLKGKGC
jgi:ferric-dicitrate binding protein FerR (iron transport regulator)